MGRGLFEKYLYECLKDNYPELKIYQDLANEINEKYYGDKYGKYIVALKNKKLTIKLAIQELPDGKNKFILRREYNLEDKAPKE